MKHLLKKNYNVQQLIIHQKGRYQRLPWQWHSQTMCCRICCHKTCLEWLAWLSLFLHWKNMPVLPVLLALCSICTVTHKLLFHTHLLKDIQANREKCASQTFQGRLVVWLSKWLMISLSLGVYRQSIKQILNLLHHMNIWAYKTSKEICYFQLPSSFRNYRRNLGNELKIFIIMKPTDCFSIQMVWWDIWKYLQKALSVVKQPSGFLKIVRDLSLKQNWWFLIMTLERHKLEGKIRRSMSEQATGLLTSGLSPNAAVPLSSAEHFNNFQLIVLVLWHTTLLFWLTLTILIGISSCRQLFSVKKFWYNHCTLPSQHQLVIGRQTKSTSWWAYCRIHQLQSQWFPSGAVGNQKTVKIWLQLVTLPPSGQEIK